MKIAFLTDNYPPVSDGVGDHTFFLAEALARQGHEIYVICNSSCKATANNNNNPAVFPLVEKWNWQGYKEAIKKLDNIRPDWLVIQYVPYAFNEWGTPFLLCYFLFAIKKQKCKILLSFHETYIRLVGTTPKTFAVGICQRIIARYLCLRADRISTSIDRYKQQLSRFTTKEITLIPIPPNYDTGISLSIEQIETIRKRISPNKKRIIATYGLRDTTLLIDVFKRVLQLYPEVVLLVCGKIKDTAPFEALGNQVVITGYLTSNEVYLYLSAADLFFIPDKIVRQNQGGTCNKSGSLAAALFAGLKVVGIRGDMNNSLLTENAAVFLEKYGDPDSICQRIISLLKNPPAIADDKFWQNKLSWNNIAQTYFPK